MESYGCLMNRNANQAARPVEYGRCGGWDRAKVGPRHQGYWNYGNVVAVRTYRQGTLSLAD